MGENTKIEWAHHSWNPWVGCTKVSPACDHCYAEGWAKRAGNPELWTGERRRTSPANWRLPLKWDRGAAAAGERPRVFCASLADVFDNQADPKWREDLWNLIAETQYLDWLLLTKRPQNIAKMLPADWGEGYPNVWLGTTVENQTEAERRIPHLRDIPAAIRFLSCEPMLGRLDLDCLIYQPCPNWSDDIPMDMTTGLRECCSQCDFVGFSDELAIHWVIAGGESGAGARPMHPAWARQLRDACAQAGIPFFFKQFGEWLPGLGELGGFIHLHDGTSRPTSRKTTHDFGEGYLAERIGKKSAGRTLDGQLHDAVPA